jgi:hypothetical protein
LRDYFAEQQIPDEHLPLFLEIFDQYNSDSMQVFDDIMVNILKYQPEIYNKIVGDYGLFDSIS